ncbi:MAG: SDR family oxidoreductase [Bacilli bacterium]|nr:SDR family oxidoreductase [Bacilli bacterium]
MKKTVLITGCAKGIGREIALEFARDGYNIIGTYNTSIKEIELLKKRIEAIGVSFDSYKLDLADEIELNKFCNNIKQRYERLDVLVNNAAIDLANNFASKTKEEFMKVLEVNLVSPFLLIQNLYNIMNGGVIINISSTDGIDTYSTLNMDYSASKAGLINLTKSLALELKNINVYCVCPNWVDTESIREMNQDYLKEEMNRIGQIKLIVPKEVARQVRDLVDSKINSGSIIVIGDSDE